MTAEDKRKYRRQARAAAAKGEEAPKPEAGTATDGTAKPALGRKAAATSAKGGVVVEAPEPIEEDEEEASDDSEDGLIKLFTDKGLQYNPRMAGAGHGFQMRSFGKQSPEFIDDKVEKILNKFFSRWGHPATQFRLFPGRILLLGIAEYSK